MIALEVKVNGKLVAVAGRDDLGVICAIVNAVGVLGTNSMGTSTVKKGHDLFLSVGGLTCKKNKELDEDLNWIEGMNLTPGDEVTIKILWKSDNEAELKPNQGIQKSKTKNSNESKKG